MGFDSFRAFGGRELPTKLSGHGSQLPGQNRVWRVRSQIGDFTERSQSPPHSGAGTSRRTNVRRAIAYPIAPTSASIRITFTDTSGLLNHARPGSTVQTPFKLIACGW